MVSINPVGTVAGGSTTVNGMIWNRGWAADYDAWEAAGITGWIETLRGRPTVELEQDRGTRPRGHRAGGRRD